MEIDQTNQKVEVDKSVLAAYETRIRELEERQKTMVPMKLTFQQTVDAPPVTKSELNGMSTRNDAVTITAWRKTWLDQARRNVKNFDISGNASISESGKYSCRPVICAGSGPSLKKNVDVLAKHKPEGIGLVSCLHNFSYFVDKGIKADCFINLDAGPLTITEVSQGGKHPEDYYWDASKDHTLIAGLVSHPDLVGRWKGKILWFDAPVPDEAYMKEREEIIPGFKNFYSVGGNALGASYYHARAILGGMPIAMIGADFAFDYMHKFHSWDSPYDEQFSGVMPCVDIFGNRVFTWQSYYNFAQWFAFQSMGGSGNNPNIMINCTEGGILGAYPTGNIRSIIQMSLYDFLTMYNHHKALPEIINDKTKPAMLLF